MAGSAAVGVRESGDGNLTAAGAFTDPVNAPVQAGSTVLETFGANDLNAAVTMQGEIGYNPFQEVNLLIGEMAKKMNCGPRAAWERVKRLGDELFRQAPLGT